MKEEFNALRRRAEIARNKLKGKKNVKIDKKYNFTVFYNSEIKVKTIPEDVYNDNELYAKLLSVLSDDSIVNPINYMIDNSYYKSLSENEKEKYLFNLIAKYRKLKERYHKEKMLNV